MLSKPIYGLSWAFDKSFLKNKTQTRLFRNTMREDLYLDWEIFEEKSYFLYYNFLVSKVVNSKNTESVLHNWAIYHSDKWLGK